MRLLIKENQIIFGRPDIVLRSQLDLELCSVLKALINCLHIKGQKMSMTHWPWTCSYRSTCDMWHSFPKNPSIVLLMFLTNKKQRKDFIHNYNYWLEDKTHWGDLYFSLDPTLLISIIYRLQIIGSPLPDYWLDLSREEMLRGFLGPGGPLGRMYVQFLSKSNQ